MMRILFLSTWYPVPADNGSKLRVAALLRALTEHHAVTLVSFSFGSARPDAESELLERCTAVHTLNIDPFEANATGALRRFASLSPVFARPIPAMQQLVHQLFAAQEFDVVIASTTSVATYALDAPAGVCRILEEHNCLTRWMYERFQQPSSALVRLRYRVSWLKARRFERRLFARFDLVTMVSDADTRVARSLSGSTPVATIPNGVDTHHNRPVQAAKRPYTLVFNGSLTYQANFAAMQFFLTAVYPLIQAQIPAVELVITGSTQGVDLSALGLDDTVHLTGYVEDVRVPVSQAVVCVVPIREGGGTRLKILEALALGTAVVSTSKGAEGLAVAHGRHLLIADDPAGFAACVVDLLVDPARRHQLTAAGRQQVTERYDWSTIGADFVGQVECRTLRTAHWRVGVGV